MIDTNFKISDLELIIVNVNTSSELGGALNTLLSYLQNLSADLNSLLTRRRAKRETALEVITSKLKLVLTQLDSILSQLDTTGMYTYKRDSPVFKKRMGDKIANFVSAAKTYYTATKTTWH